MNSISFFSFMLGKQGTRFFAKLLSRDRDVRVANAPVIAHEMPVQLGRFAS